MHSQIIYFFKDQLYKKKIFMYLLLTFQFSPNIQNIIAQKETSMRWHMENINVLVSVESNGKTLYGATWKN